MTGIGVLRTLPLRIGFEGPQLAVSEAQIRYKKQQLRDQGKAKSQNSELLVCEDWLEFVPTCCSYTNTAKPWY